MSGTVHIPLETAGDGVVRAVMMTEPRSVGPDTPMSEVRDTFASPSVKLMLITDGVRFLGTLGRDDLPEQGAGPIGPHVRADRPVLSPDDPVDRAMELVNEQGMTRIPVADGDQLLGLVCFNKSHSAFCVYPS